MYRIRYQLSQFQQCWWSACAVCLGRLPCHTPVVCSTLHQEIALQAPATNSQQRYIHGLNYWIPKIYKKKYRKSLN